jgi:hypothetical protein
MDAAHGAASTAQQLAAMWRADDDNFYEAANAAISSQAIDGELGGLADALGAEFPEVLAELRDTASWDVVGEGGRAVAQVFAVPVHGGSEDVAALLDEDMGRLADALKGSGVVHPDADLFLFPAVFDAEAAARMTPGALRWLAQACGEGVDGGVVLDALCRFGAVSSAVLPVSDVPGSAYLVTGLVVGVRILETGEGREDVVGAHSSEDAERRAEEAVLAWRAATADLASETGRNVFVSDPASWDEALACMAANIVNGALVVESDIRGIDIRNGAEEAHLHDDGQSVLVSLVASGTVVGPVVVPSALVAGARWVFDDWVEGAAKIVRRHERMAGVPGMDETTTRH